MRFGIMYANAFFPGADAATGLARIVEEAGLESVWTVEHTVVPGGYRSTYPYDPSGRMPIPDETPMPDPLVWLTWIGAATTRLRLATGILILPQRNPVVLAKEVATLDALSGGRVELGVGVGWLREEFDTIGVAFDDRGRRADDYVAALRTLWSEAEASYTGDFVRFEKANSFPHPVQQVGGRAGVPIVVGGHTKAAARRAGRLGDGFFPGTSTETDLSTLLDVMRGAARDAGRDPDSIEVTAGGTLDVDGVRRLADLGVSRVVFPPPAFDLDGVKSALDRLANDVIAHVV